MEPADAGSLARHANNPKIARHLRDGFPYPYSENDAQRFIKQVSENPDAVVYTFDVEGRACGGIGITGMKDVYRYNAEIGYWLAERYWGKGWASEAVGEMVNMAFTHYSWVRLYAGVFSNNPGSMRVLEKNGFIHEATHRHAVKKEGVFLDECIFALLRETWAASHPRG